jgi:prepilin-type N-terminal cleavage/methylation domain-containing protein
MEKKGRDMAGMKTNRSGFTLIELMIVVAIIGILAAIAIPNFITFKRKALCATAVANLETARAVLTAYAASQDDWCFPPSTNDFSVFRQNLSTYGLHFPETPQGVKWSVFHGYTRDPAFCNMYTIRIVSADGSTEFKGVTMGICCASDPASCNEYARNSPQCVTDFGL